MLATFGPIGTMRSWINGVYVIGGAVFAIVGLATITDSGEGGVAASLLTVPVAIFGLILMFGGIVMGASPTRDGVVVRGIFRKTVIPRGAVAQVAEAELDMLPLSYSYICVSIPGADELSLLRFAQYSFVERHRGGVRARPVYSTSGSAPARPPAPTAQWSLEMNEQSPHGETQGEVRR